MYWIENTCQGKTTIVQLVNAHLKWGIQLSATPPDPSMTSKWVKAINTAVNRCNSKEFDIIRQRLKALADAVSKKIKKLHHYFDMTF